MTLTARPWAVTSDDVAPVRQQGLDEQQLEAAIAVIAMFNYFTRVADASGIDFDYQTPLPAFEPDRAQVSAPRPPAPPPGPPGEAPTGSPPPGPPGEAPTGSPPPGPRGADRGRLPEHGGLRAAWASWRTYQLDNAGPLPRADRLLLARVAAEEAGDWTTAATLEPSAQPDGHVPAETPGSSARQDGHVLAGFARKLSREPWQMDATDLDRLRAAGYSEIAILHAISMTAHQNADSRLSAGLAATRT